MEASLALARGREFTTAHFVRIWNLQLSRYNQISFKIWGLLGWKRSTTPSVAKNLSAKLKMDATQSSFHLFHIGTFAKLETNGTGRFPGTSTRIRLTLFSGLTCRQQKTPPPFCNYVFNQCSTTNQVKNYTCSCNLLFAIANQ